MFIIFLVHDMSHAKKNVKKNIDLITTRGIYISKEKLKMISEISRH